MRLKHYLILLCAMLLNTVANAAPLVIEITKGVEDALPIAIVPFIVEGVPPAEAGKRPSQEIASIIRNDLARTGRFRSFAVKDMLEKPSDPKDIKFQNWRIMGVENLVIGKVRYLGADRYDVSFWLFDVFKAKQLPSYNIPGKESSLRATAHKISDVIYEQLMGEPGAFSTSIAYVTANDRNGETHYSLWMADSDGENQQALLHSKQPVMSPAWSPDGQRIAYASLEKNGRQQIFIQQWYSGRRETLEISKPGLFGAPAWSPDGKKLAFTITYNGNAEIYVLDLGSKQPTQLTHHWAIDTEAAWTPDGKSIIFTSDRSGKPQLYQTAASGGQVQRLTFEGSENARASVSPDGRYVAMAHKDNGDFIAVLDLKSGQLQVLPTEGQFAESPSFAPNGSMIIYATTKGNRAELAAVSVDGRITQSLTYDEDVRDPAWSPLNKK